MEKKSFYVSSLVVKTRSYNRDPFSSGVTYRYETMSIIRKAWNWSIKGHQNNWYL